MQPREQGKDIIVWLEQRWMGNLCKKIPNKWNASTLREASNEDAKQLIALMDKPGNKMKASDKSQLTTHNSL